MRPDKASLASWRSCRTAVGTTLTSAAMEEQTTGQTLTTVNGRVLSILNL
ncbi:hypothetical protein [Baaleninema simplex]|nr:hypothetical protein [Baaleninema simplex]